MAGEKTEQASAKKRDDERNKGHIFQSQDIVTASSLICFFVLLNIMGSTLGAQISGGMQSLIESMPVYISGASDIKSRFVTVIYTAAEVMIPIMLVMVCVTIISTMVQTRLLVSFKQLMPDFSRMSPIQGIKRLFSIKSLVELLKALLKITAIVLVIFNELSSQMSQILLLFDMSLGAVISWTAGMIIGIGLKASVAMLIIGLGDYFYQWWSYERDIKMSKEELKDEFKQTEGNPETKSRVRGMQRKMAKARMMQAVPEADVVIRNPTHFAVALKYNNNGKGAPVVVAKGQDNIALKIVEIATEHKIFVTENKPLAQALFKAVEIGDQIPAEFYKVVAEVLAYIYKLRRAGRG